MKRLEILRAKYLDYQARAKELRDLDPEKMTDTEAEELRGLIKKMKDMAADIEAEIEAEDLDIRNKPPAQPSGITVEDQPIYRGSPASMLGQQLLDIRAMSMPGARGREVEEARSRLEQCAKRTAALKKKEERTAATGGFTIDVPSDGAFTLQGETSLDLMTGGFNNSEILSRTANRTMGDGTQFIEIIGIDETSRATGSRGGGVRVYTSRELEALTASKTKFNKIRIEPKKLTGHYVASSEVMNNVTFLGQEMRQLFAEEFAFKCQDLVINGTGAGEPLGVLNAGCLISQAKETGQAAATVVFENIIKMESRIWRESPGLVYLVNREVKPQLAQLHMPIGTGGTVVPLYQQTYDMGKTLATLNGIPCVTIEQAAALGTVGDIMLCDFSQYITANRGGVDEAMSIHVYFLYDQQAFRFIYFFEGQPRWSSALTPYKGSATVGPFIALATRA